MQLGPYALRNALFVAPMAGVTDRPFRALCKRFGADFAVSEMTSSRPELRTSEKTRRRRDHAGEVAPVIVQIVGADPRAMADEARFNVDEGAAIIDINMGCPAKKVCNVAAGSALLRDERLVARILDAVVHAVDVPVTLKLRTGWDPTNRNAVRIARIAESTGIAMLSLHGRTRACGFTGTAEYETIAHVKSAVAIPVIANGDIDCPQRAREVLEGTGADGLMIGRGAQGYPWIFRETAHYLATGELLAPPSLAEFEQVMREHLAMLHAFYGEDAGVRIARKHMGWYARSLPRGAELKSKVNSAWNAEHQIEGMESFFEDLQVNAAQVQEEALAA